MQSRGKHYAAVLLLLNMPGKRLGRWRELDFRLRLITAGGVIVTEGSIVD